MRERVDTEFYSFIPDAVNYHKFPIDLKKNYDHRTILWFRDFVNSDRWHRGNLLPITSDVENIINDVESILKIQYEAIMLNLYAPGNVVPYHSDGCNESAIVSFDDDGIFTICSIEQITAPKKHAQGTAKLSGEPIAFRIQSGDIFLSKPGFHDHFVHKVEALGFRQSLVLRNGSDPFRGWIIQ